MNAMRLTTTLAATMSVSLAAAATSHAAPITVTASADGAVDDRSHDGIENGNSVNQYNYVGKRTNGTRGRLYRTVMIFELPSPPSGQTVDNAQLSVYLRDPQGTPPGDMAALHLPDVNPTSFTAPSSDNSGDVPVSSYEASGDVLKSNFVTPTSTTKQRYTLDVTNAVNADYNNDPSGAKVATFRFQVDGLTTVPNSGPKANFRYILGRSEVGARQPELDITFAPIPEPGSLALVAVGGLLLMPWRKRHSNQVDESSK